LEKVVNKEVVQATGICFQEKTIYTMEVLTIVLQQLMEQKVYQATARQTDVLYHKAFSRI
jgi:hypothetical protein